MPGSNDNLEALSSVLEKDPNRWEVRFSLIEKLVNDGELDAAKKLVRDSPDSQPVPASVQAQLHSLLTRKSDLERPSEHDHLLPESRILVEEFRVMTPASDGSTPIRKCKAIAGAMVFHLVLLLLLAGVALNQPGMRSHLLVLKTDKPEKPGSRDTVNQSHSHVRADVNPLRQITEISVDSIGGFQGTDVFSGLDGLSMTGLSSGNFEYGIELLAAPISDVTGIGSVPSTMRSRCSRQARLERLHQSGADERFEKAVIKGLNYITTRQNSRTGAFGNRYEVAMTGLCLLCYLGHCETPESPEYGDNVAKAALYLMNRSLKGHGYLTNGRSGSHEAYEHGIATYALAELHSLTNGSSKPIPRLESVLQKAVQHIIADQSDEGGWAYRNTNLDLMKRGEDLSVSGWNIQALKAARLAGIEVAGMDRAFHLAIETYLRIAQDGSGAFKYRANHPNGKESLTGVGLLGLQLGGWHGSRRYLRGLDVLMQSSPRLNPSGDYYAPYYAAQVFYYHGDVGWERFNNRFLSEMLEHQRADGSWPRVGSGYGSGEAQLLRTAFAILMLEVCYRYLPTADKMSKIEF